MISDINGVVSLNSKEGLRFQIICKYISGALNREEAARLINVNIRTITRISKKVQKKGLLGVKHGNLGKVPHFKYEREFKKRIVELFKEKYFDFNLSHFCFLLEKNHEIKIPYPTLYGWFKEIKLIKNPRRRHRRKHVYRSRLPQEGLLLQMDGCHHKFNGKDEWCLVSAIDDATSNIPYAELFSDGETTLNCMKVLSKIIERKGVPKAIYTDRAGWAGGGKRTEFSQFKRACERLGIQLIFADTPEAKGRIERSFRTIQDRLIPEMRMKGIEDLEAANQYLQNEFLGNYWNKEKVVEPIEKEPAYTPLDPWLDIHQILCVEESRVIGRDQTISWKGNRHIVSDGNHSLANYLAVFRTDLRGLTKVSVLDREVELKPIGEPAKRLDSIKPKDPLEIHPDLWIKMYSLILDANNAVKKQKVIGGPLKVDRVNRRRAG